MEGSILWVLLSLILLVLAVLTWRSWVARREMGEELQGVLTRVLLEERAHSAEGLQRHGADLAERIAKATAELRQSLTDRLNEEFRVVQERLESRLGQGRA